MPYTRTGTPLRYIPAGGLALKMELIPTKYKNKIPKGFSFPIGAKDISESLQGIPQYNKFELTFHDRDTFWSSKFHERIKGKDFITVIEISYSRYRANISTPKDWEESGYSNPNWVVRVYALPSEYRSNTKTQLLEIAMPLYKKWLNEIGDIKEFGSYRKSFILDLASGNLKEI